MDNTEWPKLQRSRDWTGEPPRTIQNVAEAIKIEGPGEEKPLIVKQRGVAEGLAERVIEG